MNDVQRVVLAIELCQHSDYLHQARIDRLEECKNQALNGDFQACERGLLFYVSMKSVHAINRCKIYTALSRLAGLVCLTKNEQRIILEQGKIEIGND